MTFVAFECLNQAGDVVPIEISPYQAYAIVGMGDHTKVAIAQGWIEVLSPMDEVRQRLADARTAYDMEQANHQEEFAARQIGAMKDWANEGEQGFSRIEKLLEAILEKLS